MEFFIMKYTDRQNALLGLLNRVNKVAQSGIQFNNEGCCPTCQNRFDPMLDRVEAWAYTGFQPGTFAVWDCKGKYNLRPMRIGNAVRYRLSTLNKFGDQHLKPE